MMNLNRCFDEHSRALTLETGGAPVARLPPAAPLPQRARRRNGGQRPQAEFPQIFPWWPASEIYYKPTLQKRCHVSMSFLTKLY